MGCEHKLIYLETKKTCDFTSSAGYQKKYTRIDVFYCERCGEIITKKIEGCYKEEPDWY